MKDKPNIILMMVDQMRWDFLGINGNENIDTPNLDMMANYGYNFKNVYTAVPSCIASRAALMTGMKQINHKRVGYRDNVEWKYENMLADEFSKNGYHTQCIGKMHVYPERKLCGFHNVLLHDGYLNASRKKKEPGIDQFQAVDDYLKWFREKMGSDVDLIDSGLGCNSWVTRPYMHPEWTHPTNWLVTESIDFLRRRDPTKAFFLKMSFVRPHSPLDPPEYYFNHYKDKEVKKPAIGKWNQEIDSHRDDYDVNAKRAVIKEKSVIEARRAYSGSITHIDDQISRFLIALEEYDELENTIILFTSDHGDMLGDHHFFRKAVSYEGSVHVPLIVYDPGNHLKGVKSEEFEEVLELRDIMPSLLDFAGLDIPQSVDGKSIKALIKGEAEEWREYIHGEHSFDEYSNHYITNGKKKYIWYSQSGIEQFFDLEEDPYEMDNLIESKDRQGDIEKFKNYLIDELRGRQEGYTDGKELIVGRAPIDLLRDETL